MRIGTAALCAMLLGSVAVAQNPPPAPPKGQSPVEAAEPGPPPPPKYSPPAPGQPAETRAPSAEGQTPVFRQQTRAPYTPSNVALNVETVAEGLEYPWGLAFLPDGRMLVTERNGRLRIVNGRDVSPPVEGLPPVKVQEISGLADVILDPNFASNHLIYWTFVESRGGGTGANTSVGRGRLVDGPAPRLEDVKIIYRQTPDLKSEHGNFGGRMVFDPTGALIVTMGDLASDPLRPYIQRLDSSVGKVVRITTDGQPAKGNPFSGKPGALPELYAVGFRNPLSIAYRPGTRELWTTDVGPRGGDELDRLKPGKNYGWPIISYGKEYSGKRVGEGTQGKGYEQPVYYWDPVISPSSIAFYTGDLFPAWKRNLFVTSLSQRHLARLVMKGDKVVGEERLLTDLDQRLREVKQGPDGALYLITDMKKGRILRLTPAARQAAGDTAPARRPG
jgi:glucose/arabinose dehydrogenase